MTAQIRQLRTGPLRVERQGRHVHVAWPEAGRAPQAHRLDCHSAPTAAMLERWLLTEPDQLDPSPRAFAERQVAVLRAVIWRARRRCGRA